MSNYVETFEDNGTHYAVYNSFAVAFFSPNNMRTREDYCHVF